MGFGWEEFWGMAIFLAVSLVPVVASTAVSWRSFRRRWWLAAPGGLFTALTAPLAWLFHAGGMTGSDGTPALAISIGMFVGSWIACGLFLATLAIVGPKLPVIDVREVF